MAKKPGRLDFDDRSRAKQAARDADAHDLASGKLSKAALNRKNSMFGGFGEGILRNARIIFPEKE